MKKTEVVVSVKFLFLVYGLSIKSKDEEIMLPFEFSVGSLFPTSYNAIKDAMTQQFIDGYNNGYEEGKKE